MNIGQAQSPPTNAAQSRDHLQTPVLDRLAVGNLNDVHAQKYSQKQQGQFKSIMHTNDDYANYNTWTTQTEQNHIRQKEYKEYNTWDIVKMQNLRLPGRQPQLEITPAKSGTGCAQKVDMQT